MASVILNNVRPELLEWAFKRAGYNEETAVEAFPQLADWLADEKLPTMAQLQKFAAKFHAPLGFLFLEKAPVESIPIPMFRGAAGRAGHFDLNVYDTVLDIQSRQDWLEEYLTGNGIDTCQLVHVVNLRTPVAEAVFRLRTALQLDPRWAFSLANADAAVNILTDRLEQAGFFIAYNGIVGNNTHRPLQVSECRGFALVNDAAPFIFVNSADSKSAQMFTLIHEAAHIMLGVSAGHAGEEENHNVTERYCDCVAAEFLVPQSVLMEIWRNDIKKAARRFKVSDLVIARRCRDLGMLSQDQYRQFWASYCLRPKTGKNAGSGGNFYLTSVKRIGRTFAIHVRNAVESRQLEYTEAYRLTGLHGKTFDHFMLNNV